MMVLAGAILVPSVATAQSSFSRVWIDVDFNFLVNAAQDDFTASTTFTLFGEPATFSTLYRLPNATGIAVGGGFMINPRVGFGVAMTNNTHEDTGFNNASVPHPAFFDAYGTDSAETDEVLPRKERGIHINVMIVAVDNGKLRVRIFGGPSHLSVTQTFVENFFYTQNWDFTPPPNFLNTIEITGHDTPIEVKQSTWGFHVGGDVSYFFNDIVGVGGTVRLVRGSVTFDNPLGGANPLDQKAGGFQIGAGVRLKIG
jgi:hypothetical protein